ncbi:neurogenic locus notch homolog protein 1-like [Cotesia glomerata]|uniref:neurogenic locus notch homolog protein 1-like n=1 Tax=Cotesia glomerata TaxID=32391 RepID=UPI001D0286D2|nr:neurogenic locus notch homolog protein 1-like [Cotesia glomerata]
MLKVNSWIISLIVIVISTECSSSNETSLDVICALKHTLCDPNLSRPCCNLIDQCQRTWPDNYFRCIGDIILNGLGKSCELDEDCDEIKHAKCSKDGKCICRMKTVRTDPWTCAPILGGFCWNNEPCAADNAVCVNSECKCKKDYSRRPNNQCVRDVLGTHCKNDDVCNLVKFAKCSKDKVCACTSNTTAVTSTYCAPIFGGFCWENDECVTPHSICLNNECQCDEKYNQYNTENGCVSKMDFYKNKISNAICTGVNDCVCFQQYPFEETYPCTPEDKNDCEADNLCVIKNSRCIDNFCQCKPHFVYRSNQCLPFVYLNDVCLNNDDCSKINHAICSKDKKCECDENYALVNQTSCRPIYGGFCSKNEDCVNINGACIDSKCGCMPFTVKFLEYWCVIPHLGMPCKSNKDCRKILNSMCSDNGKCECKIYFGEYNSTTCAPLLGQFCYEDELCAPYHSSCKNEKCVCNDGFLEHSRKKCSPHYLRMYCEDDDNCKYIANARCQNDINICTCKNGHGMVNETTCAPLLGESCFENQLCASLHSSCRNNKCKCNDGFHQYSKEKCLPHYIRMYCEDDDNCKYIANSECRTDINICACKSTHKFFNHTTCAPLLGEHCKPNEQCSIKNSHCIDDVCACRPNYENHNGNCVYVNPGSDFIQILCHEDSHCSLIKYAVCSDDNCECKPNYIPLGHDKCIGTIGEYCHSDAECYSYNTVCLNNVCQCSDKFYAFNRTYCDPIHLGLACQNNQDCLVAIKNSECSTKDEICACKKKYYAVNEFECLPSLDGDCLSNDDCRLNSTICIDNKCKCQDNFSAISETQCRPDDYFYSCEQVLDCGDPWHYTCNHDKKCRCKDNNFSINRSTCSPGLKGYCWNDSQCTIHNSTCVDFHCKCNHEFVGVSNNLCLPEYH